MMEQTIQRHTMTTKWHFWFRIRWESMMSIWTFGFDLFPVWHRPHSVIGLLLSFYYSVFAHPPTYTHIHTLSLWHKPAPHWRMLHHPRDSLFKGASFAPPCLPRCSSDPRSALVTHLPVRYLPSTLVLQEGARNVRQSKLPHNVRNTRPRWDIRSYHQRWSSGDLRRLSGSPWALTDGRSTCFPSLRMMNPSH